MALCNRCEEKDKTIAELEERVSDRSQVAGSLYSCKICGLKPYQFDDGDVGAVKFMCECGASGSWAETTDEAKVHWNKLAFCPNWNTENELK